LPRFEAESALNAMGRRGAQPLAALPDALLEVLQVPRDIALGHTGPL
jgi:hypothetical protein